MNPEQMSFFWGENAEEAAAPIPAPQVKSTATAAPGRFELRQAVIGFLAQRRPSALAAQVRLYRKRCILAAASMTIAPQGRQQLSQVASITAVEIFSDRGECLPECSGQDELLAELAKLEQDKLAMEAAVRRDEPELKLSGDLFEDAGPASYDYRASRLHPYKRLLRDIERARHSFYKGSRMEMIRSASAADFLYLAVPENLIQPHELAPGWGLIYITAGLSCRIAVEAPSQTEFVKEAMRRHLALNIARASLDNVLFANGVRIADGRIALTAPPRRRRKLRSTQ